MSKIPADLVLAMLQETAHLNGEGIDIGDNLEDDFKDNGTISNEELAKITGDAQDDCDEICNCDDCDFQDNCIICHCKDECDDERDDECDDDEIYVDDEVFMEAFVALIEAVLKSFGASLVKDAKILRNTKKRTTTVIWSDGTVTIVKAAKGEKMNDYHAFTAAFAKRMLGSNTKINHIVEKTVEMQLSPKKK